MRANASAGPADDRYPTLAGVRLYPRLALHRLRRHFRLRPHDVDAPLEIRSEEHTSELQSLRHLVCRLLLEKKKTDCRRIHHVAPAVSVSACASHRLTA